MAEITWKTVEPRELKGIPLADMPGHRTRAYLLHQAYVVLDNNVPICDPVVGSCRVDRMWYMVVAYIGKEDIAFEILHTSMGNKENNTTDSHNPKMRIWQPLDPQTFANLFNDQDGNPTSGLAKLSLNKYNWAENVHVTVDGGNRVLMKFSRKYVEDQLDSITLYTIGNTLPGILLGRIGDIIALMERYPVIKTIADAKQAKTALGDLDESIWQARTLWQGVDVNNRQRLINNIVTAQHDIEKCNNEYDDICAKAAHAMDVLSQKYGIDIYI